LETIEKAFARIGYRVRIEQDSVQGNTMTTGVLSAGRLAPARIRVNVEKDRRGEVFQVTIGEGVSLQIMQMDRALRHLLLYACDQEKAKYRYLCGHDERGLFAAAVPGGVSNVVDAMEALKPETVLRSQHGLSAEERNKRRNPAFLRQGEWYFVPAAGGSFDQKLLLRNEPIRRGRSKPHIVEEVFRCGGEAVYVCRQFPNGIDEGAYQKQLLSSPEARHWGWSLMRRNMDVFGRGKVKHPDHRTIVLNGWHQILPNREAEAPFIETLVFLD